MYELIRIAKQNQLVTNIAVSGWHFDHLVLDKFKKLNVDGIFISLNGSTEEINSLTRDGYDFAIRALDTIKTYGFEKSYINWVCHSNNIIDFENMLSLAESYDIKFLSVLSFKPNANNKLLTFPSGKEIRILAEKIKKYSGPVTIIVESCFSQLLAILRETKLFGNLNIGEDKGCRAGIYNYCINVDGSYSPCRHLYYPEKFSTLEEYLTQSMVINTIRNVEKNIRKPCVDCMYRKYCRPCLAINSKMEGDIFIGHRICSIHSE